MLPPQRSGSGKASVCWQLIHRSRRAEGRMPWAMSNIRGWWQREQVWSCPAGLDYMACSMCLDGVFLQSQRTVGNNVSFICLLNFSFMRAVVDPTFLDTLHQRWSCLSFLSLECWPPIHISLPSGNQGKNKQEMTLEFKSRLPACSGNNVVGKLAAPTSPGLLICKIRTLKNKQRKFLLNS